MHLMAHAMCDERHTVTGLISAAGHQDKDWSKRYRLYSSQVKDRQLFDPIIKGTLELLSPEQPFVIAVDDSTMKKTGKTIPDAGWHRDALGPPFHTNLIYGHKFLQLSGAILNPDNKYQARMVPIGFCLIPKLPKLQKDCSPEEQAVYEKQKQANTPSAHAIRQLEHVRNSIDKIEPENKRSLWICGDGHYSTTKMIQNLPTNSVYLGRIRGDTCIHGLPLIKKNGRGRKPSYGKKLPTPEEFRKDKNIPWKTMNIKKGNGYINIRYKHISKAKWRVAGEKKVVQILVIAPFRFKKKKNGPWRYTQPTYLICSKASISIRAIIQTYLWRWDIEVNFRDEKQLFGLGQAQVRNNKSITAAPATCIASYAGLILASVRHLGFNRDPLTIIAPKWHHKKRRQRPSTNELRLQIKKELTGRSLLCANFSDFSSIIPQQQKYEKLIKAQTLNQKRNTG